MKYITVEAFDETNWRKEADRIYHIILCSKDKNTKTLVSWNDERITKDIICSVHMDDIGAEVVTEGEKKYICVDYGAVYEVFEEDDDPEEGLCDPFGALENEYDPYGEEDFMS